MGEADTSQKETAGLCTHCLSAPAWRNGLCTECDAKQTMQNSDVHPSN